MGRPSSQRYRDWCFTDYNCDPKRLKEIRTTYIRWGSEICPTSGREHLQGFLSVDEPITLKEVCVLVNIDDEENALRIGRKQGKWKPLHLGERKGSVRDASDYCWAVGRYKHKNCKGYDKSTKLCADPLCQGGSPNVVCFEQGVEPPEDDPKIQGSRTDMQFARDMVKTGMSVIQFTELCRSHQALKLYKELLPIYEQPRSKKPVVYWLYGGTDTGKTTRAVALFARKGMTYLNRGLFKQSLSQNHWEGYDGQLGLFIDEFVDTKFEFKFFLELLSEPMQVNMKYGSRQMQATHIVISANKPPEDCYPWLTEQNNGIEHLLKRLRLVSHHKNRLGKCVKGKPYIEKDYDGNLSEAFEDDDQASTDP